MRVKDIEQGLGELRISVLDLLVHPRRKEREGLDHPLDMGVFAALAVQQQARSQFGIAFAELSLVASQKSQFPLVIGQQILHCQAARMIAALPPWPRGRLTE